MNKNWHIKTRDETQRRHAVDFNHNFFRLSVITGLTLMADVVRFFFGLLAVIHLYTSSIYYHFWSNLVCVAFRECVDYNRYSILQWNVTLENVSWTRILMIMRWSAFIKVGCSLVTCIIQFPCRNIINLA